MEQLYAVDVVLCPYCGQNNYSKNLSCRCCGAPIPIELTSAPNFDFRPVYCGSTGVHNVSEQIFDDIDLDQGYLKSEERKELKILSSSSLPSASVSPSISASYTYKR